MSAHVRARQDDPHIRGGLIVARALHKRAQIPKPQLYLIPNKPIDSRAQIFMGDLEAEALCLVTCCTETV